jgi:hypothetical protein
MGKTFAPGDPAGVDLGKPQTTLMNAFIQLQDGAFYEDVLSVRDRELLDWFNTTPTARPDAMG